MWTEWWTCVQENGRRKSVRQSSQSLSDRVGWRERDTGRASERLWTSECKDKPSKVKFRRGGHGMRLEGVRSRVATAAVCQGPRRRKGGLPLKRVRDTRSLYLREPPPIHRDLCPLSRRGTGPNAECAGGESAYMHRAHGDFPVLCPQGSQHEQAARMRSLDSPAGDFGPRQTGASDWRSS